MIAQELPVMRDTEQMSEILDKAVYQFQRYYKYTLGERMYTLSLDLIELIFMANQDQQNRTLYLQRFTAKFGVLQYLIRRATDKQLLSLRYSADLAILCERIGKQVTAWRKSSARE